MNLTTSAILIDANQQKKPVQVTWNNSTMTVQDRPYVYTDARFEIGGNQNSLLFIHLKNNESLYIQINSQLKVELLKIESQKHIFEKLFKNHTKNRTLNIATIATILLILINLVYFRSAISGALSGLIPQKLEKSIADKLFSKSDKFKSHSAAEEKLVHLVSELNGYSPQQYTVHLSSDMNLNAYATIGGHIFINKGLIKSLKSPEELLGVVSHEMVHAKNRHVIKSVFQSAGLFFLFQFLIGDFTGIAAVLVDGGGPLLQLSYSRDLETEADLEAVQIMIDSQINPEGLAKALSLIETEQQKLKSEIPGGEELDKITNQTFLRSHPKSDDRILNIQNQIKIISENVKYKNIIYKNLNKPWADLQESIQQL